MNQSITLKNSIRNYTESDQKHCQKREKKNKADNMMKMKI